MPERMPSFSTMTFKNNSFPSLLRYALPPVIALMVLLVSWESLVQALNIKSYFLPSPVDVVSAACKIRMELLSAVWLTARAAVCGFLLSIVFGSTVAMLFAQMTWVRIGCFPYAVLLQTVPIVAIAPLMINWQGPGFGSVMSIAFIVSAFPIIANVTAGLTSVDRGLLDVFRLQRASRWQIALKLQVPHAIPDLVTGARTSAGLAVIGAIVGEFFAGNSTRQHGLGFMIPQRIHWMKTDEAFAAVAAATLLGVIMFSVVSLLRSTVLGRWCQPRS